MADIELASRVREVVVYARGAVVVREAPLPPDLPGDSCELVLPGFTAQSEGGSLRASTDTGRDVVALRSRLVWPSAVVTATDTTSRERALERERTRLEEERTQLLAWRDDAARIAPSPDLASRSGRPDPLARALDYLAVNRISQDTVASLEARLEELNDLLEENGKAREKLRLEALRARTQDRGLAPKPTREVRVRLAGRSGEAREGRLFVTYSVAAARWWPAYAARLSKGGTRVDWAIDAFVAQASDEDWAGVRLSLATADRIQDVRLPELPSLRLGRAQPKARRGFRPPPPGLDELFAGYDRFHGSAKARRPQPPLPPPIPVQLAAAPASMDLGFAKMEMSAEITPPPMEEAKMAAPKPMLSRGAAPAPMRARAAFGGGGPPPGAPPSFEQPPPPPPPLGPPEITEDWLDFDQLQLADVDHHASRGRLERQERPETNAAVTSLLAIERCSAHVHARDPRETRGNFDHRYDASGPCDVPSDAAAHRVTLAHAAAEAKARLVTVPLETNDVFRSAELDNTFGAPLLAGPVDVYLDGSLVTTSLLSGVDKGGTISLGLGVEDRVKVARNVRASEESAGLLGGQLAVQHDVTIELSSTLGFPVKIEVLDRVPVTDDNELAVSVGPAKPPFEKYDQAARGSPVRGGLRWMLELAPGGRAKVEFGYRLAFSNRLEVVGGNRRD